MAFLTDLISDALGTSQANKQQAKIADTYAAAQKTASAAYAPYGATGQVANTNVSNMLTPGFKFSPTDPSYAFRQQQGQQGVDRELAAHGETLSGGQIKATDNYNSGLASTEYGAEFGRNLQTAEGLGIPAASGTATAAFNAANGQASAYGKTGANNAAFWGNTAASINDAGQQAARLFGYGG